METALQVKSIYVSKTCWAICNRKTVSNEWRQERLATTRTLKLPGGKCHACVGKNRETSETLWLPRDHQFIRSSVLSRYLDNDCLPITVLTPCASPLLGSETKILITQALDRYSEKILRSCKGLSMFDMSVRSNLASEKRKMASALDG